jgi:hypothetical protein
MSLTRAQIKQMASHQLREYLGSDGAESEVMYDTLISAAADELARSTDCYAGSVGADVVAGQSIYSAPNLYKVYGVFWTDASLNKVELVETTTRELDDRYSNLATSAGWRNSPAGSPIYYYTRGENIVGLYPTPDTSSLVFNYTDLVLNPTNQYMVSSSGQRVFGPDDVGYTLRVTGGNQFTTGIYLIIAVDGSGNATVDQPIGQVFTVSGASDASPIVITTAASQQLTTGQTVVVAGVLGNTAANGTWTITALTTTTFSLNSSTGNGGYTSGGTISALGSATLSTGGLYVEGLLVPASSWQGQTSTCPLPHRAHIAVVWRTAIMRCVQYPTADNLRRIPFLNEEYRKAKGYLEAEVSRLTQATQHADRSRFPFGGGYY